VKQGRADRDVRESVKVEPRARAINPGGVDAMGQKFWHDNLKTPLRDGPGYNAPPRTTDARPGPGSGRTIHPSGSQGKR